MISCSWDGTIRLWRLNLLSNQPIRMTLESIGVIRSHEKSVTHVCTTLMEKNDVHTALLVVSCSADYTVRTHSVFIQTNQSEPIIIQLQSMEFSPAKMIEVVHVCAFPCFASEQEYLLLLGGVDCKILFMASKTTELLCPIFEDPIAVDGHQVCNSIKNLSHFEYKTRSFLLLLPLLFPSISSCCFP